MFIIMLHRNSHVMGIEKFMLILLCWWIYISMELCVYGG